MHVMTSLYDVYVVLIMVKSSYAYILDYSEKI